MITEVFKYRSYIQGLITENLDIMTSKKLQRKVYIKSSSEDRQADAREVSPYNGELSHSEDSPNWENGSQNQCLYSDRYLTSKKHR